MTMATKTRKVLDRAYELVESVPYQVSLRWLFYKLLQESFYSGKGDYSKWKALCARYRKNLHKKWRPDTLSDDTRSRIDRTGGRSTVQEYIDDLPLRLSSGIDFYVDHFYHQPCYLEIWFEARGMSGQFKYYTEDIDLVPFGGDPSIPFKWDIAKKLEESERYGKDLVVLYFGDYDKHGLEILDFALSDIRTWCNSNFEVVRCGLTEEQANHYQVPENPDKPGEYQWEALSDEAAQEIIQANLSDYIDVSLIDKLNEEAREKTELWQDKVFHVIDDLVTGEAD